VRAEELTEAGLIFGASARAEGRNVLERLRAFEALYPFPSGVAADLGCGRGAYVVDLAKRFDQVIGIDVLPASLDDAQVNAPSNVEFRCAPLEDVPLESETLDAAFLIEVLDHVNSVERSLIELRRVLKPGAIAYVSVPNALFPFEIHPVRIFGRFFHPWLFPFLNWTPFHDSLATARTFHKGSLSRLFESLELLVIASDYVILPLENRFRFMRPVLAVAARTPLKPVIGVSLVFALENRWKQT
jgi:SAM-dependent methyltransferase